MGYYMCEHAYFSFLPAAAAAGMQQCHVKYHYYFFEASTHAQIINWIALLDIRGTFYRHYHAGRVTLSCISCQPDIMHSPCIHALTLLHNFISLVAACMQLI